jgi:hypothetical protein
MIYEAWCPVIIHLYSAYIADGRREPIFDERHIASDRFEPE